MCCALIELVDVDLTFVVLFVDCHLGVFYLLSVLPIVRISSLATVSTAPANMRWANTRIQDADW